LSGSRLLGVTQRDRVRRLLQHDAAAGSGDFVPGMPVRPRIWGARLTAAEQAWGQAVACRKRSYEDAQRADPGVAAVWQRQSRPRLLPTERAEQRQHEREQQQQRQQQQAPAGRADVLPAAAARRRWWRCFDDPLGGMAPFVPELPWQGVWYRLHRVPAPREHRALAWRVLHNSLPCAARTAAWERWPRDAYGGSCWRDACHAAGAPETLSHIFMECPVAQQVTAWAASLWAAVAQRPTRRLQ
jgi:hypothetical protein